MCTPCGNAKREDKQHHFKEKHGYAHTTLMVTDSKHPLFPCITGGLAIMAKTFMRILLLVADSRTSHFREWSLMTHFPAVGYIKRSALVAKA